MQILRTEDPRDPLQKATRDELVDFAKLRGWIDINEQMPKPLIIRKLKEKGVGSIPIPDRPLGGFKTKDSYGIEAEQPEVPTVDADEALIKQWEATKDEPIAKSPDEMSIQELRRTLKAMGVTTARTDNLATLREKLRGQNAA